SCDRLHGDPLGGADAADARRSVRLRRAARPAVVSFRATFAVRRRGPGRAALAGRTRRGPRAAARGAAHARRVRPPRGPRRTGPPSCRGVPLTPRDGKTLAP